MARNCNRIGRKSRQIQEVHSHPQVKAVTSKAVVVVVAAVPEVLVELGEEVEVKATQELVVVVMGLVVESHL